MASLEEDLTGDRTGDAPRGSLIFVSDASAEAERLTVALRSRGYPTVDVPLGLLTTRVAVQRPALILCDADAPRVLEVAEAACRDAEGEICVVFLGDPDGLISKEPEQLQRQASAIFTRPVEVYSLLRKVEALIGAPPEGLSGSLLPPARTPVLVAAARKPYMADMSHARGTAAGRAVARQDSNMPAVPSSMPPDLGWQPEHIEPEAQLSLLPEEPARVTGEASHAHMSPELASLLREAEQHLETKPLGDLRIQRLSPEAELDAVLPPDLLATLDEPLDDEDDFEFDVGPGTKSGSEPGRTSPGSQSGAHPDEETDDPRSRATNPGGAMPPAREAERSERGHTTNELPRTEPPPTPSAAPVTPRPASLSLQSAATAVRAPLETDAGGESQQFTDSDSNAGNTSETGEDVPVPTSRPPHWKPRDEARAETPASKPLAVEAPAPPDANDPVHPGPAGDSSVPTRPLGLPRQLGPRVACNAVASAVRKRLSGALVLEDGDGIRRIVFRDGDFVMAASSVGSESLTAFLVQRGDLETEIASQLSRRLPPFGRHAGAALIANGHLKQDELWTVLRAHAEWLIGLVLRLESGNLDWETEVPDRLRSEPAVFGGSTGAEVFVETVRRIVDPRQALAELGNDTTLLHGPDFDLLSECALRPVEADFVRRAPELSFEEAKRAGAPSDLATLCIALVELGVLSRDAATSARRAPPHQKSEDPLDDQALRARVLARYALVEEGDYFALLGVARGATDYEIQKAHEDLKRELLPARILTARNADLGETLDTVLEVLDEAFDVLGDRVRRERYRRALEAAPG